MEELTGRQREILHFIVRQTEERGFPPTIREIGEEMDIRSTNGVNDHLKALERKGYLLRGEQQSPGAGPHQAGPAGPGNGRPSQGLGDDRGPPAGQGRRRSAAARGRERRGLGPHRQLPARGQHGREVFALRVKGDSMVDDGIHDGDYLFVRKTPTAREGDIVVALIEDEATCKRYYPEGDRIRFQPANKGMAPHLRPPHAVPLDDDPRAGGGRVPQGPLTRGAAFASRRRPSDRPQLVEQTTRRPAAASAALGTLTTWRCAGSGAGGAPSILSGSTGAPSWRTSKCRCGPLVFPDSPTVARTCPSRTVCPVRTRRSRLWA